MSGTAEVVAMAAVMPVTTEVVAETAVQVPAVVRPVEAAGRGLCIAVTTAGEVNPVRTAQLAVNAYWNQ